MVMTFLDFDFAKDVAVDCMLGYNRSYSVLDHPDGFAVVPTEQYSILIRLNPAKELFRAEA